MPADRHLANGQCMAFERLPFLGAGGMLPVAGQVVEDVALARHLAGREWRVAMLDGHQLLTTRMYESLADTWRGWGRSLALPGEAKAVALAGPLDGGTGQTVFVATGSHGLAIATVSPASIFKLAPFRMSLSPV